MLEGASPLNPIYIIKARRASDFIIYYFFFILFVEQELDKLLFVLFFIKLLHIHVCSDYAVKSIYAVNEICSLRIIIHYHLDIQKKTDYG